MEQELQEDIKSVQAMMAQAEELAKQKSRIEIRINEAWFNIQQRIKGGESSGDRLDDLIIAKYRSLNPETKKRFVDMEERFKGLQGQLIMLVKKDNERIRWGGSEKPGDYITKTTLEVSVLRGENFFTLAQSDSIILFPTIEKYVSFSDSLFFRDSIIRMTNKKLSLSFFNNGELRDSSELQIIIGDAEVVDWFVRSNDHSDYLLAVFQQISVVLGRILDFPELTNFLEKNKSELSAAWRSLNTEKVYLATELERLKNLHKHDEKMQKRLDEIPKEVTKVENEAKKLGIVLIAELT